MTGVRPERTQAPRDRDRTPAAQPAGDLEGVRGLAASVGNAAFGELAGASTVHARPAPPPGAAVAGDVGLTLALARVVSRRREPGGAAPQKLPPQAAGAALEQRVDQVATTAREARERAAQTVDDGFKQVDATAAELEALTAVYKLAFERFELTLHTADAHARGAEQIKDLVLTLAIGAAVGASLGFALAGVAAATPFQQALKTSSTVIVNWGGKQAAKDPVARGPGVVARSREFLAKADPNLMRIEAGQNLRKLDRGLAELLVVINQHARVADWCLDVKADARELASTGRHGKLTVEQLAERVATLEEAGKAQSGLRDQVLLVAARVADAAQAAGAARKDADTTRLERQLWIHWMASLSGDDAQMVDEDPIEERLQDLGIAGDRGRSPVDRSMIGWYIGDWHGKADSKEGVRRAKPYADALRAVGIVGVLHDAEVKGIATGVEYDWRGEPRKPSREHAYTTGRIDLGGTPGDPSRPWARKDGWAVIVAGEAEDGDNVRVTGVQGGDRPTDTPTLLGQLLKDERRGVQRPDFRTKWRNVF